MDWIKENWFFLLFFIFFIGMHLSGHGCCGHGHKKEEEQDTHVRQIPSEKKDQDGDD